MYGLVNKAIEGLVTDNYGKDTWIKVREGAGVGEDEFISNEGYPDKMTYDLVEAACNVLQLPADAILKSFGEYWVLTTASKGYGDLMDAAGDNMADFLTYLPTSILGCS